MSYSDLAHRLEHRYHTKNEFEALLREYAEEHGLDGIYYSVEKKQEALETPCCYFYGFECKDYSPTVQKTLTIEFSASSITVSYSIWSKKNTACNIERDVEEIINSFLDTSHVGRCTLLPTYGDPSKLEITINRFLELKKFVAVFMIDLDHFKDVNSNFGHENADTVIFEYGNLLASLSEERAVVIHRSGDEFYIIMPCDNLIDPLDLAYHIGDKARQHAYKKAPKMILTAAQGIYIASQPVTSFPDIIKYAENAYSGKSSENGEDSENAKEGEDGKKRDSVRFYQPSPVGKIQEPALDRNLAYVLTRSQLDDLHVFRNPFLDFISLMMSRCGDSKKITPEIVNKEVEHWLSWLKPDPVLGMRFLDQNADDDLICAWSYEELAFALFHGICRNTACHGKKVNLVFNPEQSESFQILLDDKIVYSYGQAFDPASFSDYTIQLPDCPIDDCTIRNTVLVRIGYGPLPIPNCFYRVIKIDTRPSTGGNLPDFWAGALSELISLMSVDESVDHVIVYGNASNAQNICNILHDIENWGTQEYTWDVLAKQTKQSPTGIQNCKERLTGRITFIDEEDTNKLIQELMCTYSEAHLRRREPSADKTHEHRFLNRRLVDDSFQLQLKDGCTVGTMEEAYPLILEILRSHTGTEMSDEAGRKLKELDNFRLTITNPSSKSIPQYFREQTTDLEQYYKNSFGTEDGFFQKHLKEGGQYDAVLQHIVKLINANGLKYATRRALLVVPHIIEDQNNITPLGLVSVHISPRQINNEIVFHFSFTWRTVEAVIGLPYSLFGSVKYAETLLEEIKERLHNAQTPVLKMGNVSYIAYSLHMFLDPPYEQIVRGIINDATR